MIEIAIVEDLQEEAAILKTHIARFEEENNQTCKVFCFKDGLDFLDKYNRTYDVIFMDIDMPFMNGMKIAKRLRNLDSQVPLVFVTKMKQYAIEGYSVSALDFMLKPVSYYKFSAILKKIVKNQGERGVEKTIHTKGGVRLIKLDSIYYIEVMGRDIIYHTEEGDIHTYGRLKNLEEELVMHNFVRCNNCYLVNLRHVKEVHKDMILVGEAQITISQRKRKDFMQALGVYLGESR